jgi:probable addiction module antidote protein
MVTIAKWDAAEVLTSPERIAAYLEVALEDDDPEVLKVALGNIARAKGMAEIAKKAGIRRTSLYRALSPEGNPEFATLRASSRLWASGCRLPRKGAPGAGLQPAPVVPPRPSHGRWRDVAAGRHRSPGRVSSPRAESGTVNNRPSTPRPILVCPERSRTAQIHPATLPEVNQAARTRASGYIAHQGGQEAKRRTRSRCEATTDDASAHK